MKIVLKSGLASLLLTAVHVLAQGSTQFAETRYVTQPDAKHTRSVKGILNLDETSGRVSFIEKGEQTIAVPYAQIESMRIERSINRLRVPFSEKVDHQEFLTIEYRGSDNRLTYALFQLNGRSYREVLAALEAQTQKQITWKAD